MVLFGSGRGISVSVNSAAGISPSVFPPRSTTTPCSASHEGIEVKVVAYTEHGVVVDLGGKTEGLIPAAEFTDTEIPRPEPNSTIEVQRTGEHKDGFTILSYLKVLRRRTWEKIDAAFKAKETITGKVVDRIKGGLVVDIGVR